MELPNLILIFCFGLISTASAAKNVENFCAPSQSGVINLLINKINKGQVVEAAEDYNFVRDLSLVAPILHGVLDNLTQANDSIKSNTINNVQGFISDLTNEEDRMLALSTLIDVIESNSPKFYEFMFNIYSQVIKLSSGNANKLKEKLSEKISKESVNRIKNNLTETVFAGINSNVNVFLDLNITEKIVQELYNAEADQFTSVVSLIESLPVNDLVFRGALKLLQEMKKYYQLDNEYLIHFAQRLKHRTVSSRYWQALVDGFPDIIKNLVFNDGKVQRLRNLAWNEYLYLSKTTSSFAWRKIYTLASGVENESQSYFNILSIDQQGRHRLQSKGFKDEYPYAYKNAKDSCRREVYAWRMGGFDDSATFSFIPTKNATCFQISNEMYKSLLIANEVKENKGHYVYLTPQACLAGRYDEACWVLEN